LLIEDNIETLYKRQQLFTFKFNPTPHLLEIINLIIRNDND